MKKHMKKQGLIKSLKIAITALENDTVYYNWQEHHSCNCGIVAQAATGMSSGEIWELFSPLQLGKKNKTKKQLTWKSATHIYCTITGQTEEEIFKKLFKAGLSAEDIVHLEYLENPAILKRAGLTIDVTRINKVKTGETKELVPVAKTVRAKGLLGLFGKTVNVIVNEEKISEHFEYQEIKTTEYENEYYKKKSNLIKYLKAWVSILEERPKQDDEQATLNKVQLQEELLKAASNEEYEKAAIIRDRIASMP